MSYIDPNERNEFVNMAHANGWVIFPLAESSKKPNEGQTGHLSWTVEDSKDFLPELRNTRNNLGIVTGRESGLFVIDIDTKNGATPDTLRALCSGNLPTTRVHRTPSGGWHYFFRYPQDVERVKCSAGDIAKGIDVRGDGGYVVAPTSHIDGTPYTVESDVDVAEAPSELVELVKGIKYTPSGTVPRPEALSDSEREMFARFVNEAVQNIASATDGTRHNTAVREGTIAFRRAAWAGMPWNEVLEACEHAYVLSGGTDFKDFTRCMADAQRYAEESPYEYTPWSERELSFDPAELLDEIVNALRMFVYLPDPKWYDVIALWVAQTYFVRYSISVDIAPRLGFVSGVPGSGKTLALDLVTLLCGGLQMTESSSAAILRTQQGMVNGDDRINKEDAPIMLAIDEIDNLYAAKASETGGMTAVLNSGYKRGAKVYKADQNDQNNVFAYDCFGPIAFAGLAKARLPEALLTRSFVVNMQKATNKERPNVFRARKHTDMFTSKCSMLSEWAKRDSADDDKINAILDEAEEELCEIVAARDLELWSALGVPAMLAGDEWWKRLKVACETFKDASKVSGETPAVMFLRATRDVWKQHVTSGKQVLIREEAGANEKNVHRDYLAAVVPELEPFFKDFARKEFSGAHVVDLLREFDLSPKQCKIGGKNKQGYSWDDLAKLWDRYLGADEEAEG